MERRLRGEEVMTIGVLYERGMSKRAIARQLGVDEKAVRYRLRRLASEAVDGRSGKPFRAEPCFAPEFHGVMLGACRLSAYNELRNACRSRTSWSVSVIPDITELIVLRSLTTSPPLPLRSGVPLGSCAPAL